MFTFLTMFKMKEMLVKKVTLPDLKPAMIFKPLSFMSLIVLMSMLMSITPGLIAFPSFNSTIYASTPQAYDTELPSEDIVIASYNVKDSPYNAAGDGKADDTGAIQQAINDASRDGGGVVFIPSGIYRIDGNITIARGVTLRGEWKRPTEEDMVVEGTILAAYSGKGDENSSPLITLSRNSSIQNMSIWYPQQQANDPIPYPWTIAFTDRDGVGHTVRNVTLVNSYKGIGHGYEGDVNIYNNNIIRDVYGTPLKYGIWLELNLDISRIYRVSFSPQYWKSSGLPGAPEGGIGYDKLKDWLLHNGTGLTIRKVDGYELYSTKIDGYGIGIELSYNRTLGEDSPHPRIFTPFGGGAMYDVSVRRANVGLLVDGIGSSLISNSQFYAGRGDNATAVKVTDIIHHGLQFNQVSFWGDCQTIYIDEGIKRSLPFREREFSIHNIVSLQNCTIIVPYKDAYEEDYDEKHFKNYAIQALSGIVSIQGCEFKRFVRDESETGNSDDGTGNGDTATPHIFIGEDVRRATILGNSFSVVLGRPEKDRDVYSDHSDYGLNYQKDLDLVDKTNSYDEVCIFDKTYLYDDEIGIHNEIGKRAIIDHEKIEFAKFEDVVYPFPPEPQPHTYDLFVVTDFGATGTGSSDDTQAFKNALKAAADKGGGTVYVPAGAYRITSPLRVETGVELRGTFEAPHHTEAPGSVILINHSAGQEEGPAAISLEPNSGVRGLSFWYIQQDFFNVQPYPWTIQSEGPGCWVKDVTLGNSYKGVDFGTAEDNSNHFVSGLYGAPLKEGLRIDNSPGGGFVINCHFIEYFGPSNRPPSEEGPMYNNLTAYSFGHAEDQFILGIFVFAANRGIQIFPSDSGPFRGIIHLGSIDVPQVGLEITASDAHADVVSWWAAPSYDKAHSQVATGPGFAGALRVFNSNSWGYGDVLSIDGQGIVTIQQLGTDLAASRIQGGQVEVVNLKGRRGHLFNIGSDIEKALLIGNMSDRSFRVDNKAGDKTTLIHNNPNPSGFMWNAIKIGAIVLAVIALLAYLSVKTN